MKFVYLGILLFSFCGVLILDWQLKLAFFNKPKAATKTILLATAVFLLVDIVGVNYQIFSTNQAYVVGIGLGSEDIPLEELIFLLFLNYFVLCVYRLILSRQTKNV